MFVPDIRYVIICNLQIYTQEKYELCSNRCTLISQILFYNFFLLHLIVMSYDFVKTIKKIMFNF